MSPRRTSLYKDVTSRILKQLEGGTVPWVQPWFVEKPRNLVSKRSYSGVNVLLLWQRAAEQGFCLSSWLTFNQAKELGGRVRKGEHGTRIVFTKRGVRKDKKTSEERPYWFLRYYTVFNAEQVEGLPEAAYQRPVKHFLTDVQPMVEGFLTSIGANVRHIGCEAVYRPSQDVIYMPSKESFVTASDYYATSLHEHAHWTGHRSRLDRFGPIAPGVRSTEYAMEELIAELTSAFVCAEFGIEQLTPAASYIDSWVQLLRDSDKAVFSAAREATKAAEFLMEKGKVSHDGSNA